MQITFDHSEELAPGIRTFYFQKPEAFRYTAGQFIKLTLSVAHPDERGSSHWFTLSSSPTQELLSITTRHAAEHGSAFKEVLFSLEPGSTVEMSEPMGDFVLPKDPAVPLIFVAGGIGITPFHSIMQWLIDKGEERSIAFLYGVRTEDDIIFQETFEKASQHVTIVVSNPSEAWGGERGQITAELILGLEAPAANTLIYLSGPEPMVDALKQDLIDRGLPKEQLVTDAFPGYSGV